MYHILAILRRGQKAEGSIELYFMYKVEDISTITQKKIGVANKNKVPVYEQKAYVSPTNIKMNSFLPILLNSFINV